MGFGGSAHPESLPNHSKNICQDHLQALDGALIASCGFGLVHFFYTEPPRRLQPGTQRFDVPLHELDDDILGASRCFRSFKSRK